MLRFVLMICSFMTGLLFASDVFAQVDLESGAELLRPVLEVALSYLPANAVAILLLVGGLRVLFKPVMAALEAIAIYTPTKKDDKLYQELKESKAYKILRFVVDYIASIKLPEKKK